MGPNPTISRQSRQSRARTARPRSKPANSPPPPVVPDDAEGFPVVGIGASAGGLDACRKLLQSVPAETGMAFILIQHLDPHHESMMVDLLASHTSMTVREAADGMPIEPGNLYVIPPGAYLSVSNGTLRLSEPNVRHGARLPFDFLLHSLAAEYGARAICVILSGTGSDGSLGLKAVSAAGGLVVAQDPEETSFDGMPRSAIDTGSVDLVLALAKIPEALVAHEKALAEGRARIGTEQPPETQDWSSRVIDLLRTKTAHDFTLYKKGTLQRRIERRMAMAEVEPGNVERYVAMLEEDPNELELLEKDLLINVTSFFRDPDVFNYLATEVIPELVREHPVGQPIRIWVAGCSSGEETYSLAMLLLEEIAASKRNIKLQVFASDVDPDAVAEAREGLFTDKIEAEITPGRLARFFIKEDHGYRVNSDLRGCVVFTVQDVLADPPFSRLDLISCRNLLIYLQPEAQAKVISLFHFALRAGGILLLGKSETVGKADGLFEVISKPARLYRHVGRSRPGNLLKSLNAIDGIRPMLRAKLGPPPTRQGDFGDLCRRLVMDLYAPAAVLINRKHECLYVLGPTDRYLRVVPGHPTQDVLAMAREGVRTKLRSAIQQAGEKHARVVVANGRTSDNGTVRSFHIVAQPVQGEGTELLLICFVEDPESQPESGHSVASQEDSRVAELERELETTRVELEGAIHNLETSYEAQKEINEEALSINEEFQSTNEELLTSKEELQSLNEELTALNSQLQETMERHRSTADDLQNVLFSTHVATIFLNRKLEIRFFTPAVRSLFSIIPGDIGRPLADLNSLATDRTLAADAQAVLQTQETIDCEIEGRKGAWYLRRITPYRTQEKAVEGVVITFTDITERRRSADALEEARRQSQLANLAKSRFLSAASHDLRQPLQTLALVHGILAKIVEDTKGQQLLRRAEGTLAAMTGMLNSLLDLNQIEAGAIRTEVVVFPIHDMFERLKDEFTYHAEARGLTLRVVPCGLSIRSDPRLLEQIVRNLLSNALKYTRLGKVLLGARRHGNVLTIEVWDTGIGIPEPEIKRIFDEYHQIDNDAREQARGLGLGLSIVRSLANLLGHPIRVRSNLGKGSVFAFDVDIVSSTSVGPDEKPSDEHRRGTAVDAVADSASRSGTILVVEDEPDLRELLETLLVDEGHRVLTASDSVAALELLAGNKARPDIIIADYNLPKGLNGLQFSVNLQATLRRDIPVIILTGDISGDTMLDIAKRKFLQINKPVKASQLTQVVHDLLPISHRAPQTGQPHIASDPTGPVVYLVDDDNNVRESLRNALMYGGMTVEDYPSAEAFLDAFHPRPDACLLVDGYLPGISGLELLRRLKSDGHRLPAVMITGSSDITMAVQAMKAGASDFIVKPVGNEELVAVMSRALKLARDTKKRSVAQADAAEQIAKLTPRQRQVLKRVLAGHPSKNIAADLGISQRTVENHRAAIMHATGVKSIPALARLAFDADQSDGDISSADRSPAVRNQSGPKGSRKTHR